MAKFQLQAICRKPRSSVYIRIATLQTLCESTCFFGSGVYRAPPIPQWWHRLPALAKASLYDYIPESLFFLDRKKHRELLIDVERKGKMLTTANST